MDLKFLRESVRRNLVKNDINVLDILATGHNLVNCIQGKQWERMDKKLSQFVGSYNHLVENLNKMDTPVEDKILSLEEEIEALKNPKQH